ncbi:hypothetical protein LJR034_009052 [Caballeronia sp. LjRoot34]|uniref:hypothetical protein n=1 Tax=Caballeronia sp. LjRoot34 TaxID=3342325 RepID=UPI003ECDC364
MGGKPTADGGGDGSWQGAVLRYVAQSLYAKIIIALIVIYYVVAVVGAAVGRFNLTWHGVFPIVVISNGPDRLRPPESEPSTAPHNPSSDVSVASSTVGKTPPEPLPPSAPAPTSAGNIFYGGFGKTTHELIVNHVDVERENVRISYHQEVLGHSMLVYQDLEGDDQKTGRARGVIQYSGRENRTEGSVGITPESAEEMCQASGLKKLMDSARDEFGLADKVAYSKTNTNTNPDSVATTSWFKNGALWNFSDKSKLVVRTSFARTWWASGGSGWQCTVEVCAIPPNGKACFDLPSP